ncbi:MAG: NDP-sugar synthase, partial [Vampirovibrionales bacterium]
MFSLFPAAASSSSSQDPSSSEEDIMACEVQDAMTPSKNLPLHHTPFTSQMSAVPTLTYCSSFGTPELTLALRDRLRWERQALSPEHGSASLIQQWILKDYEGTPLALAWLPLACEYDLQAFMGKGGLYLVVTNPCTSMRYVLLPGSSLRLGQRHAQSLVDENAKMLVQSAFLEVTLLESASCMQKTPLPFDSWLFNAIESYTKQVATASAEGESPYALGVPADAVPTKLKQAMILGAGIGSRTLPLTDDVMGIAKPALPFAEGNTVIGHLLDQVAALGVDTIFVNTCQHAASVQEVLHEKQQQYQALNLTTQIVCIAEEEPTGTAGALRTLLHAPEAYPAFDPQAPLLVLQGDTVTNVDLSVFVTTMMKAYHATPSFAVGIGCKEVPDPWVTQFGIMAVEPLTHQFEGCVGGDVQKIIAFKEKPSLQEAGSDRLASTGIYFLTPRVYATLQTLTPHQEVTLQPADRSVRDPILDFAKDVFPSFLSSSDVMLALPLQGYWFDIGTPHQYYHVLASLLRGYLPMPFTYTPRSEGADACCHYASGEVMIAWPHTQALMAQDVPQASGAVLAM